MRGRFNPRSASVILRSHGRRYRSCFRRMLSRANRCPGIPSYPLPNGNLHQCRNGQKAAGGHQEFDVVSVRQNKSGYPWSGGDQIVMNVPYGPDDNYRVTGGILSAKNYPLLNLIVFAYKVPTAQGEALLASLPDWTNKELFDIEARTDNHDVTKDQMRLMMQSLLAERFHLVIHRELRQVE